MKKVVVFITVMVITLLISVNCIYAVNLILEVKTDKNTAQIGDTVTVTVDWQTGMQAADYILKYDSEKLEYVSSSISDTYMKKSQAGQIEIFWVSMEEKDLSNMTFTFKVIKEGTAKFSVEIAGGFADGQMHRPESYDVSSKGTKTITLTGKTTQNPSENGNNSNNSDNSNNNGGGSNQPNSNGTTQNGGTNSSDEKKPTQLPYAGDSSMILGIIGIILSIAIVVFYIKYKKYKEI